MKQKVIRILKSHGFNDVEFDDVFYAMREILELAADETEEKEPHATNTIRRYRDIASDISDLESFCNLHE